MSIPANAKYAIIQEMTARDNNRLNIKWLCDAAGVSRSGYYYYLSTEKERAAREKEDRAAFQIILEGKTLFPQLCKTNYGHFS